MSHAASRGIVTTQEARRVEQAQDILRTEAEAVLAVAAQLDESFAHAVELMLKCRGNIVVTGVGKAGLVGRKVTATLSSLGCPAHFMHPTEAVHGDLGCLNPDDVILALSNSGESAEVLALLNTLKELGLAIIAITADDSSTLASYATVVVSIGKMPEAGPLALAPTCSTTAMMAVGDALALVASRAKGFSRNDFAMVHPAGKIGARLKRVREVMRNPEELRIANETSTLRDLLVQVARPGRRTGAVLLVDEHNHLSGLFTDSDLARLLEQHRDSQLDEPASETMTPNPITIQPEARVAEAIDLMSSRKLSELPVVDAAGVPVGLLDITDLIGLGSPVRSTKPHLRVTHAP